jgi:fatty acid desaturase
MSTLVRTIEFLALSLWLGSDVFLSFAVAPGAFRVLAGRDQAGAMVGFALWWMHMIGVVCGIVLLIARLSRTRAVSSLVAPAALCVLAMIGLTVVSQHAVSSKMAALRVQMGSIQATAADNPLLAEFSRLHRLSVSLESGVLLAGFAAMYLMVKELTLCL